MKYTLTNKNSINETIKNCNPGDSILLKNGIYNEKVEITVDQLTISGESQEGVIITNHDYYHKIMSDYNECNTFRTYTLYIGSNDVKLSNLTIKNASTPSQVYGQAVALHAAGTRLEISNVTLISAQDTLFTGPLPPNLIERYQGFLPQYLLKDTPTIQKYINCTIYGDVDFIFGGATALFDGCNIISISRNIKDAREPNGYVAAPSHLESVEFGYLFLNCNIQAEKMVSSVYLARPWRDYGSAAFINCKFSDHIHPLGFNKWGNTNRDKTARFYEYSPNADTTKREPWAHMLTQSEAELYVEKFKKYIK